MKHNVYNVGLSDANLSKQELLEKIQQYLNKKGKNLPGFAKWLGNFAFDLGQGGITGLAAGGVTGVSAC